MADSSDPFSTVLPFQLPEQVRAFAEKGVSQARDSYSKLRDVAETNNGTIEAMFSTASKGATDYSAKMFEIVKTNTGASFDFAHSLFGAKTLPEVLEMWTSHAKKQVEVMTTQTKELTELSQKVAAEAVEPIKASASKLFTSAA
ncbi:phasin [Rhodopseudomonas pseudopalustris]|uniref:Phasin 2 n=2 Tax=Rhodopseudomonas TaxID=1073 RepID=Q13B53_RHOPS|nr:phasin [Rhodopseudomonas pseudopalustris]ABE38686.1 Phasin 2 [Rhodopseudomonas palustris BisB5]MBB1093431.1 phasin [Rhodopseudomonas palustris]SEO38519.1 phasin [Rhodopseudomonas pseudopalustris]